MGIAQIMGSCPKILVGKPKGNPSVPPKRPTVSVHTTLRLNAQKLFPVATNGSSEFRRMILEFVAVA